ncbi:hypothetical protein QFZ52_001379 [Arthrobacter woluwensis]|uniref:hypothetical protein n=1 Tax=Arthrobacter woluwensis TaxID=156980 RepID=UPI0027843D62|nr:hypothetical protein [Arthrobacter woluwensis]MDQ0708727.1 hypothetical protein [Arthrobacter woluwensis]
MKNIRFPSLITLAALWLSMISGAPAANAQSPSASEGATPGTLVSALSPSETKQVAEDLAQFHDMLQAHKVTHTQAANGDTTYTLAPGIKVTYPGAEESTSPTVQPEVGGGWDPWPYFEFDPSEQQALISGSAATLAGAICAIAGSESAGVGCAVGGGIVLTIVGIAKAHGACPNNQTMRLYPLLGVAGVSCH